MSKEFRVVVFLGNRNIYAVKYSLRRYFIDEFYIRNIGVFNQGAIILDMGGKKKNKRGYFDIENYLISVKYANIDVSAEPDFLCDVTNIPVPDTTFDGVVCSEILEHVFDPMTVLEEAFRVLKPGGILLICVPFIKRIHPDPQDYGRYTNYYWQMILKAIGFTDIEIERHGLFFSVASEMLTDLAHQIVREKNSWFVKRTFRIWAALGKKMALKLDDKPHFKNHPFFKSYTTGYGIIATKPE